MAEKLVSNLLDQLISVPSRQLQNQINLVSGVENEVANLSSKLTEIGRLLHDAERRKLKEPRVRDWLEKLQDLAYDVNDVLDEWNTEIHKYQIEVAQSINGSSSTFWDQVRSFFLTYCLCCKEISVRRRIAVKIRNLNKRLDQIYGEREDLNFVVLNSESEQFQRPDKTTTSMFNESQPPLGRQKDKDMVVNQLLCAKDHNNNSIQICIVSIVGTGGIGKTTLAQVVYNDIEVEDHFDLRKWVSVSDPFDQIRIAKAILEGTEKSSPHVSELETLVQRIKELVSGKKFLLVLDDVWTEDKDKWQKIRNSLESGAPGSSILVTTRSERVARMMGTNYQYSLKELMDSDCWSVLSRIAFSGRSDEEREKFKEIGLEISKRCKGLPLAATFLGNLLQLKDTVQQWQNVLASEIWELEEATFDLFPHIYFSYDELSPEMRRCFLYCAVFPKDRRIDVQELIRIWMAQGYLGSSGTAKQLESSGYECFTNLAKRSFFQNLKKDPHDKDQIISCKMHDIVHDFAQHLVNGECLTIKDLAEAKNLSRGKVRHLCWSNKGDVAVRAVVGNVGKFWSFYSIGANVAFDLFGFLKCVRVLSLKGTNLKELPGAIGNLSHLRYLDLSSNPLEILPEEICDLYNLETLSISFCPQLIQFPQRIENLVNLRYLLNSRTNVKQFSQGIEKLTSLRVLKELKVGKGYSKLEYLRNLNQLGGKIRIEFFEEVNEVNLDNAKLRDKTDITELEFVFYGTGTNYEFVVKASELPPNLKVLHMVEYPHSKLPSSIMSLNNLRILHIIGGNVAFLPALGKLPSLEILQLDALKGIVVLEREFLGVTESPAVQSPFPKLKTLELKFLQNLRVWEDLREEDENIVSAIMPCLQRLIIHRCKRIKRLPHCLLRRVPSLNVLEMIGCPTLAQRYRKNRGDDWIHISHIPTVIAIRSDFVLAWREAFKHSQR